MKKTVSRVLALLLTLVLVISAIPVALADGETTPTTTPATDISISGGTSVVVGTDLQLTAAVEPSEATGVVSWNSPSDAVTLTPGENGRTCTVHGNKYAEAVQITASIDGHEAQTSISVQRQTVTPTTTKNVELEVGKSTTVTFSDFVSSLPNETAGTLSLTPVDNATVTVLENGTITAKAFGTATITGTISRPETEYSNAIAETPVTINVTVSASQLTVSNPSNIEVGSTGSVTASVAGAPEGSVTYTFTPSSNLTEVSKTATSFTYRGNAIGKASVKVTATVTLAGLEPVVLEKTVYLGVYDNLDIKATMKSGVNVLYFNSSSSLSELYDSKNGNTNLVAISSSNTLANRFTLGSNAVSFLEFDVTSSAAGELSDDWTGQLGINSLTFTSKGIGGEFITTYTGYASDGETPVRYGTLTIKLSGSSGDILYSTDGKTKVTFDENDFVKFWNKQNVSSSLSYVSFEVVSGTFPRYGVLYTSTALNKTVNSGMEFVANYTNQTNYYDLDTVTYVPATNSYGVQSVTIPFTCHGKTSSEKVSGIVVISLTGDGTSISSRGVRFGADGYDITSLMESTFKATTNTQLSYVTFPTVDAKYGKLFSSFSSMLDSTSVNKDWKFYVSASGSQLKLDDVVFVPRAGLSGKVTIYFVGYSGSNQATTCSITFNVQTKSASAVFSDVTASSYSWAADSVDFLYYEEVANGSNGKYNPAASITRGDFMLMLYRAFLEDEYKDYNVTSNFPDVVKGSDSYSKETYQAVGVAKYLGIAQGSNGKYNPKAYITREEAMTLIYRTLDKVGYSMSYTVSTSTSSFSDYSSVSSYAQAAIKDLIGHGVVVGTNGKIQPKSNITRAEMAVILHRVLTY